MYSPMCRLARYILSILFIVLSYSSCVSSQAGTATRFLVIPPRGRINAEVTIYQFSDFQCSYCREGARVLGELNKEFPNRLKVYFKHLPLPQHSQAVTASKAALAAGLQGKFWEMHDSLFENQGRLSEQTYLETATALGLDVKRFNQDRKSEQLDTLLAADYAHAKSLRITGTPTFVINGRVVRGYQRIETFREILNANLGKK